MFNGYSFRSNFSWYRLYFYISFCCYQSLNTVVFFCSTFQRVFKPYYLTISPIVLIPVLRPCFPTSERLCFNSGATVYFKPEKNSSILALLYITPNLNIRRTYLYWYLDVTGRPWFPFTRIVAQGLLSQTGMI